MLTYKKAGVDIQAGNALVEWIKSKVSGIGGFSGTLPLPHQKNTLLVASADGVGTKLKLAFLIHKHDTIGIDLVAMNVNDLVCCGAKPLFFLDYFACHRLNLSVARQVLTGIIEGCRLADCSLLGGETAEMPGIYQPGEYDLAGFSVGIATRKNLLTGRSAGAGNILIGIPSSGLHSNGFSLVRKIYNDKELEKRAPEFLIPTRIYVKAVLQLLKRKTVIHSLSHITGGGFIENLPRAVPKKYSVVIHQNSWEVPPLFQEIQQRARLNQAAMFRTFNMGMGMVLIAPEKSYASVKKVLRDARVIGHLERGQGTVLFSES